MTQVHQLPPEEYRVYCAVRGLGEPCPFENCVLTEYEPEAEAPAARPDWMSPWSPWVTIGDPLDWSTQQEWFAGWAFKSLPSVSVKVVK